MTSEDSSTPEAHVTDEVPVCPRCIQEMPIDAHFCPSCELPVSPLAFAVPTESAVVTGRMYGDLILKKRPSLIVVLVAWIWALPFLALAYAALHADELHMPRWMLWAVVFGMGGFWILLAGKLTWERYRRRGLRERP